MPVNDFEISAEWPSPHYFPMVPGHEVAGIVEEVGTGVTNFKKGQQVGVGCMVDSCRNCDNCSRGLQQYCCGGGAVYTYNGLITVRGNSNHLFRTSPSIFRMSPKFTSTTIHKAKSLTEGTLLGSQLTKNMSWTSLSPFHRQLQGHSYVQVIFLHSGESLN